MKDWILQYADEDYDDSVDKSEEEYDPVSFISYHH
jgi:hypothetical protein